MSAEDYHEALSRVLSLTPEEQLELLEEVISIVRHQAKPRPKHKVMEFRGVGKETWQSIDVEKYIEEERNSWNR